MKFHDVVQGSEDWHALRLGRLGGSDAHALLVNGKSENGIGEGLKTILYKKVAEIVAGWTASEFVNSDMERGLELEPLARRCYEDTHMLTVRQIGYISLGEYIGYSPDGLVGEDGLIEIKCPAAPEFVRFSLERAIDPKHLAQMHWGMFVSGRSWCDYVVYHPDFANEMVVTRVLSDADVIARIGQKVKVYNDTIEAALSIFY